MALLGGRLQEAESILLHNGMVFQAIYNNVNLHNWTRYSTQNVSVRFQSNIFFRALDLAIKHKTHIDTVLYLRQKYLENLNKAENNNKFNTLKESVRFIIHNKCKYF